MSKEIKELEKLITITAETELKRVRYNGSRELICVLLYVSILENAHAVVALIHSGYGHTSRILIRTIFEGYVDLVNLANDEDYLDELSDEYEKALNRVVRNAKNENPYFKAIAGHPLVNARIESQARVMKDRPVHTKRIDKFKKANLNPEYEAIYGNLCDHSHNNIGALLFKHRDYSEADRLKLEVFRQRMPQECLLEGELCFNLVKMASITLHGFFETGRVGIFEAVEFSS